MESWRAKLAEGDAQAAWDLFITRYRRLILATIRRSLLEDDDVVELFAEICATLGIDDLARLRLHEESPERQFSTWLVTVVHHHCIDWLRKRDGRRRVRTPTGLSPVRQEIFQRVFVDRRSHVEAYELLRDGSAAGLSFGAFLREVRETYRATERSRGKAATYYLAGPPASFEQPELNADDAMMDLSTWLSAARWITASGRKSANRFFRRSASQISPCTKR